jgi:hypothetical protein
MARWTRRREWHTRRSCRWTRPCITELDATTAHELAVAALSSTPPLLLPASRAPPWPSSSPPRFRAAPGTARQPCGPLRPAAVVPTRHRRRFLRPRPPPPSTGTDSTHRDAVPATLLLLPSSDSWRGKNRGWRENTEKCTAALSDARFALHVVYAVGS